MYGLANNLLRIAATYRHATGWGSSAVVHAVGALVMTAWLGATFFEPPQLPGRQTDARVELVSTWTEPELPPPAVEIAPWEPQIVVRRDSVIVGEKTYKHSPTDVSDPAPEEIAMVEDMLAPLTDAASRRELLASPSEEPPIREIPRENRPASVPVVSIPQDRSAGAGADVLPKMLENRPPDYPHRAFVERREGTVVLRIVITAEGTVGNLEIAASSGHPILDAAAVQAARSWHFVPARRFGRPIPYTVRLPVRFALD